MQYNCLHSLQATNNSDVLQSSATISSSDDASQRQLVQIVDPDGTATSQFLTVSNYIAQDTMFQIPITLNPIDLIL